MLYGISSSGVPEVSDCQLPLQHLPKIFTTFIAATQCAEFMPNFLFSTQGIAISSVCSPAIGVFK
jgi:hypothetical protein